MCILKYCLGKEPCSVGPTGWDPLRLPCERSLRGERAGAGLSPKHRPRVHTAAACVGEAQAPCVRNNFVGRFVTRVRK